jgi:hypothetical protein
MGGNGERGGSGERNGSMVQRRSDQHRLAGEGNLAMVQTALSRASRYRHSWMMWQPGRMFSRHWLAAVLTRAVLRFSLLLLLSHFVCSFLPSLLPSI